MARGRERCQTEVRCVHKEKEQGKIARSFAAYNFGIFCFWSAYLGLTNLQSSINVKDGLGTITLGAAYFVSVLCGIVVAPVVIRKFGAKTCLVIADMSLVPFIVANLFPTYYTLLPAGILMAILQSPIWPSMTMMNVLFASQFSGVSKRAKEIHTITFSGYFFTCFQAAQVFGSLVSYVILYGIDQIPIPGADGIPSNCTYTNTTTNASCHANAVDYTYCGVNDCQDESVISGAMEQYKPVNRVSFYVLIGVTALLELVAILVHAILLPTDGKFEKKMREYEAAVIVKTGETTEQRTKLTESVEGVEDDCNDAGPVVQDKKAQIAPMRLIVETVKSVCKHSINLKVLLLAPITLYNGLAMAFAGSELTRSLASCALGVQWVGICMAIYALADSILSCVVGKFGRKIGRIPMFIVGLVLECGNYLYCFLWSGGPNVLISIFVVFFTFGCTDGIFQTIINGMGIFCLFSFLCPILFFLSIAVTHIDYFSKEQDVAIAVWNVLVETGLGLGFALSTAFCVGTRIYFNLVFLCIGIAGLVIAEILHRRTVSAEARSKADALPEESL